MTHEQIAAYMQPKLQQAFDDVMDDVRSEERRVGKECGS